MFKSGFGFSAVKVGLDDEVVGDNIRSNGGLGDEAMERKEIGVLGLTKKCSEDGIHREDSGTAVRVDGVASVKSGFVEIIAADEAEDMVVEVEALARDGGDSFRELWGIRVLYGFRWG